MTETTFNPAKRRLCPDGACVGVVGDDGRCRVCDLSGDGSVAALPFAGGGGDQHEAEADADADDLGLAGAPGAADHRGGDLGFRPDRRLCDDGSCVGVIENSGACSVCGRAAGS